MAPTATANKSDKKLNVDKRREGELVQFHAKVRWYECKPGWPEHHGPGQITYHPPVVVDFGPYGLAALDPRDESPGGDAERIKLMREHIKQGRPIVAESGLIELEHGETVPPDPNWVNMNPDFKLQLAQQAKWSQERITQAVLYEREHGGDETLIKRLDAMLDPEPAADASALVKPEL